MKRITRYITIMVLCLAVSPGLFVRAYEDKSFASEEEALDYFVQEMRECDFEGALQAFPVVRAPEEFDFEKYVDRFQTWISSDSMNYSSDCELYKKINQSNFVSLRMNYICNFAKFLSSDTAFLSNASIMTEDTDVVGLMQAAAADTQKISKLEVVRLDYCEPELQDREDLQEAWREQAAVYGADGLSQYFVLYCMGDEFYLGGVTFIQYGEEYYLWELDCTLSGGSMQGAVMAVTEEEYNNIVLTQ